MRLGPTRTISQFLHVFAAILLLSVPVSAQTVLNFPRVVSGSNVFTGLAVGNPTPELVTVTFTAYGSDGMLVGGTGVENPLTVEVAAGGQLSRLYSELFGAADFNGWVQATSATSGLTGFFLNANPAVTDLDGAIALSAEVEYVLPFAVEDATAKTEVTVVNPGEEAATATLTLYGMDGSQLGTVSVSLEAKSLLRQTLTGLFAEADLSSASHVVVTGDRALVAHEVVVDFQVTGTALRRETIAAGGRIPTESTRQILSQFVSGAGWLSFIGLVNTAQTTQDLVLTAKKDDGTLWELPENPVTVTLGANASWRGTVAELFAITDDTQLSVGWIDITTPVGFVTSYIGFGNQTTPSFALVSGTEIERGSRLQVYSQVAEGAGFFTGLTIVNPGETDAEVEFFTLLPDGTTVGKATFTIPANGRIGRLYRELLPAALEQVGGWAYLRSSVDVVSAALFGGINGFALANVPAETITTDFIPPAQIAAAITGRVTQDGVGVGDVTVSLSGPVTQTRTTDADGRFIFSQLPPGSYTVTASRIGAQLVPAERTVELALENVDGQDFQAGGVVPSEAPGLSFVSPSSTFSGNQLLNITVLGSEFNPASVVQFNGESLQTTFVSSVELQAVIPSAQLSQIGDAQITVTTPPPGGGTTSASVFVVNPEPDNPLIEGRVSVGSFPAGVAIHPTRQIAVVSNESSDNVSVIDLNSLTVTETITVGRSLGEGVDIHAELDLALVANVGSNDVSVIDLATMTVTATVEVGRFPLGLAIDQTRNLAVVVSGEDATASVIDLNTLTVTSTIQVGSRPAGVAVNSVTGIAVVTSRGQNTVSLVDLNARANVATIPVEGIFPRGVAIDETRNLAVVTNANSNTVSLIDLNDRRLIQTVNVGVAPTGVGIHELTAHAVISNSGVTQSSSGLGGLTTASIVDLTERELAEDVPVGSAAFGVDVDEASQMAVVVNFGSNDVTVIRVPNPTPRIEDVEPKTFQAGGGEFTVTITGTGFLPISVVTLNGQALPTIYISSTELRAVVSASLMDELLQVSGAVTALTGAARIPQTNPVNFNLGVTNGDKQSPPTPGGNTAIEPLNPAPVLRTLSPSQIEVGASALVLTANGINFNATSVLNFGGSAHSPIDSSETSITVVIPGSELASGIVDVSIANPAPGGGTSGSLSFTVTETRNPVPVISSVSPQSVTVGSAGVGLSIGGEGFIPGTALSLGGQTLNATITPTSIDASIPADLLQVPGTLSGVIANPVPGGGAASFSISVLTAPPEVSGFSPSEAGVGVATDITVTGGQLPGQFGDHGGRDPDWDRLYQ